MKTVEDLIAMFCKGNENLFKLSPKQKDWIIGVAEREGILENHGFAYTIVLPNKKRFLIKQCRVRASGGSYVASKAINTYRAELHYMIRYAETGITEFRSYDNVDRIKREGHIFEII